jgi:spore coat protein CotH
MITRESVKAEIDWAGEQYLEVLSKFIKTLQSSDRDHQSLMDKLKTVEIHAPSDFAQNIDAYLDEEKHVE